ncbi:MAG: CBS domain-containing protein [Nitrospiraceae bacterium]|nr:CBS domain-containing protein [Nitrospiraceae bacterium]
MDLITTHLNADFDGLASMVAAAKLYPGALLVFPGGAQESVRRFLSTHDVGIRRLKDVPLDQIRRLVLVDVQEPERIGPFKVLWDNPDVAVQIYDHHHVDGAGIEKGRVSRIGELDCEVQEVGATTTILAGLLRSRNITLTPDEATVLALGLYEETGSFAFASTTPLDLEAAAWLVRTGADLNLVSEIIKHPLDSELIALLDDLLGSAETYYLEGRKILLASSTYDKYPGDLAEAVQRVAEMQGLDAVIVAMALDDKVEIIGRSRRPDIDVGWIAREFGGGGHAVAAAASVKGKTLVEVRERLRSLLTERYRPTLLAKDVMTKPVKVIGAQATVAETERMMTTASVNVLPVLDPNERFLGTVSRETVQKALFHQLGQAAIADFVQSDQYSASPDTAFHEVESRMIERNQRFVPVLSGNKVIGVITRTDLLRTLHDDVLSAARGQAGLPASGSQGGPMRKRDIRGILAERLPQPLIHLLRRAGELAERRDCAAYVVGGVVRDLLLGIDNLDLDLVVEGDGIAFARALGKETGGRVKAHERFGTAVVVLPDGFKLDVATARTEFYEYPTALPTVEQSSIKKDLYRRDFTINTLAVRINPGSFGELIDFYGGQRDLKERTIRVLHSLSFVEDPTRVFRAIRFELRFGFHLSKETLALIRGAVKMELFHRLSGHRLLDELRLLFSERAPAGAVRRMAELDLLPFIHPRLNWSARLERLLMAVEEALDWYRLSYLDRPMEAWLVYVMALLQVLPDRALQELLKRFPFSEKERSMLRAARCLPGSIARRLHARGTVRPSEVVRLLSGLPHETLVFVLASAKSESAKRRVSAYLTTYQHTKPALTGKALQLIGLKPGPLFRTILARLTEARLDGEVHTEADERALVSRLTHAKSAE